MRIVKFREVKLLTQTHKATTWQRREKNPGVWNFKLEFCYYLHNQLHPDIYGAWSMSAHIPSV